MRSDPTPDLTHPDHFVRRHIGPDAGEQREMLAELGLASLAELVERTVPPAIRREPLRLPRARSEAEALADLKDLAKRNSVRRSYLGMGFHDCVVPAVIQRNLLENPGWYTQYTPYQAEIAQGRLESLLNFQTMVTDLTGLEIANASLLDEATAAAEAMGLCLAVVDDGRRRFFVADDCHPQTVAVLRTRAEPLGIECVIGNANAFLPDAAFFGAILPYPSTDGLLRDHRALIGRLHDAGALAVVATDLLALALIAPPGELDADVAVGNSQRFGVPLGYGGPHAAFFATRAAYKRHMPGRLVGVAKDAQGRPALRLALQTREQHIRREKATSNICTAQALLANMAAMYAVYHGPRGITAIARRLHLNAVILAAGLRKIGCTVAEPFFDTLRVEGHDADEVIARAETHGVNLRRLGGRAVGIALDETVGPAEIAELWAIFNHGKVTTLAVIDIALEVDAALPKALERTSAFLQHPVFNRHHSETSMLRYLRMLETRDLSLTQSMIPLGSCTMKLNATSEMLPISWPEFARIHPFAPLAQCRGYRELFRQLEGWLAEITGFAAVSLQPNAGSQGEYAGLLAIRAWHASRKACDRDVCLIPTSAHGTNPASAAMVGLRVVAVSCCADGDIDLSDLRAKAGEHAARLCCLMVTYPSTHGVFEEGIAEACRIVHAHGGQVYMDGANMNAQVGLTSPGRIGADVCHLNLHKTFCIPHGGGGPGMGPIAVAAHLAPFLPGHPFSDGRHDGAVAAAPWGSASILTISWMYIAMMGGEGLTEATAVAILNANYIAKRLSAHFPVLYRGRGGLVAHECIIDLRPFKASAGIEVEDVAKRLIDYGFHAPTMSFPVPGTMMIEPTESESRAELDRFCAAMIEIHAEILAIAAGSSDRSDNPLKHAPHTADLVSADAWPHAYSRQRAAFPAPWIREHKFWPAVGRIDNAYGDRNLQCTCPPMMLSSIESHG